MKTLQSRIVVDGIIYGEGIRWHRDRLWFSDMHDNKVYNHDPATGRTEVVVETDDMPSGLGFLPDGTLLIVLARSRRLARLDPDGLHTVADMSSVSAMINDMVVAPGGRAYIDSHFALGEEGGGLILVEPDGSYRTVAEDMKAPNGLAITPDGKTLFVNDLLGYCLLAFDIAPDGSLENRRVFADLGDRSPDGLCLDEAGGAWVGLPFQSKFVRIGPDGNVTHEILCENKWGVAPVLGGPGRRTLYLCTARVALEDMVEMMKDSRHAIGRCQGWIEAVEGIEVAGAGWP